MAVVVDKFEATKTYIYDVSNDKGLDNEKYFDATSIHVSEYQNYKNIQQSFGEVAQDGVLESIAWHPNEENVLFVSCSLEGRSNHVYFQAKNVEDSEPLFDYKYFHRPKLAIGKIHAVRSHSLIRGVFIQSCPAEAKNFTNYVFCHG